MKGMKQNGGEGKKAYKGHKTDMKLGQNGGEVMKGKMDMGLLDPKKMGEEYCGPGRKLASY